MHAKILYTVFICSSFDGHVAGFPVLATVSSAAVNTGVQCLFNKLISGLQGKQPEVGLLDTLILEKILVLLDAQV